MSDVLEEAQRAVEEWQRRYEQERATADRLEEENRELRTQLSGLRHVMKACAIKPPEVVMRTTPWDDEPVPCIDMGPTEPDCTCISHGGECWIHPLDGGFNPYR